MSYGYDDYGAEEWTPPPPNPRPLPRVTTTVMVKGTKAMGIDLHGLDPGLFVELRSEPDNPVDPNAVQVLDEGRLLGYIPKEIAARMDPDEWEAVIETVLFHEGAPSGLRLQMRPRGRFVESDDW